MRDIDRVDCQKLFPRDDMSNIEGITTRSGESSGLRLSKGNILWRGCWQYLTCGVTSKHVHRVRAMFGCTMMCVGSMLRGWEHSLARDLCRELLWRMFLSPIRTDCGLWGKTSSIQLQRGRLSLRSRCFRWVWLEWWCEKIQVLSHRGGHIRKPFYSCSPNLSALYLICHLPS